MLSCKITKLPWSKNLYLRAYFLCPICYWRCWVKLGMWKKAFLRTGSHSNANFRHVNHFQHVVLYRRDYSYDTDRPDRSHFVASLDFLGPIPWTCRSRWNCENVVYRLVVRKHLCSHIRRVAALLIDSVKKKPRKLQLPDCISLSNTQK